MTCGHHNETVGVRHQRLLAFGPSLASLTSDLTLVSPAFGRPDLASELPLVPRVIQILYLITDWLFKNVFLPETAVGQKRSREMNRFFQ